MIFSIDFIKCPLIGKREFIFTIIVYSKKIVILKI